MIINEFFINKSKFDNISWQSDKLVKDILKNSNMFFGITNKSLLNRGKSGKDNSNRKQLKEDGENLSLYAETFNKIANNDLVRPVNKSSHGVMYLYDDDGKRHCISVEEKSYDELPSTVIYTSDDIKGKNVVVDFGEKEYDGTPLYSWFTITKKTTADNPKSSIYSNTEIREEVVEKQYVIQERIKRALDCKIIRGFFDAAGVIDSYEKYCQIMRTIRDAVLLTYSEFI